MKYNSSLLSTFESFDKSVNNDLNKCFKLTNNDNLKNKKLLYENDFWLNVLKIENQSIFLNYVDKWRYLITI